MAVRLIAIASLLLAGLASAQTDQRPGPEGEFGKTIQVGRERPLYFTLKSAEYRVDRHMVDDYLWAPTEQEKLLVIHYSVQNSTKKPIDYTALYPTFEVYDSENNGYQMVDKLGVGLEDTGKRPKGQLQPAQTILLYTAFRVPNKAQCSKLLVLPSSTTEPVVRYKLDGKIAALKAPYADPADPAGLTMRVDVPAKLGEAYPMAWFDASVIGPREGLPGPTRPAPKGSHWVAYDASLRLIGTKAKSMLLAALPAVVTLAAGTEVPITSLHGLDSWQMLNQEMRPDSEMKVRMLFAIPDGAEVKSLRFRVAGLDNAWKRYTHSFMYDLTPPPAP